MKLRSGSLRFLRVVALCGLLTSPALAQDQHVDRARELLQLFLNGKYEEFVAAGDDKVKGGFRPEQARQIAEQLTQQLGSYQSEKSARPRLVEGLHTVAFELAYERGILKMDVVVDDQGRLAGFWIRGIEANQPYEPPAYVDRNAFREEKVAVVTGSIELPATLSLPVTRAKHPGLVLVHGSGPHDEDESVLANKPFRDLAWGLASRGVAVLRYQKRTHKYGATMKPDEVTLDIETIDDAVSAARLLRQREDLDPKRVYVLGHSLGGMAAPYIAEKDPELAGLIILAGNARSLLEVVPEQIEYIANLDGQISDEEQQQLDQARQAAAAIRDNKLDDLKQPLLGAPTAYWLDLHRRDPAAKAATLKCPILIIQGGRDYQVNMKCFERWRSALKDRGNVTFKRYEKLNHLMVAGDGPSRPEEYATPGHVDEPVVRDIARWIQSAGKPE